MAKGISLLRSRAGMFYLSLVLVGDPRERRQDGYGYY
jgi:hypothetical protein